MAPGDPAGAHLYSCLLLKSPGQISLLEPSPKELSWRASWLNPSHQIPSSGQGASSGSVLHWGSGTVSEFDLSCRRPPCFEWRQDGHKPICIQSGRCNLCFLFCDRPLDTPYHPQSAPQCEVPPLLLQLDFISLKPRWPQLRAMWHQTVPETQRMELPSAHPPFYKRAIQFGKLSAFPASGHRSRGGLEPRPNGLDWDHVQHGAARAQSSHHGFECLNSKQRFGERGNESHWSEENPAPAFIFCLIPTNRAPTASTVCPEDWRAHIKSNFILLSPE